jgi:hypothetical protein
MQSLTYDFQTIRDYVLPRYDNQPSDFPATRNTIIKLVVDCYMANNYVLNQQQISEVSDTLLLQLHPEFQVEYMEKHLYWVADDDEEVREEIEDEDLEANDEPLAEGEEEEF